ncbi:hypothetical protein KO481_40125 [Nocardia sp. NEAU-G5]|uniref:Uncharacterized protein n=1 Tax=Nocardia albiluteola TaxID=2842303 RepID=A0ABS6BBQ4_9NOCA|nr:hypothetical protein [Nocardia albiluteola]MBU3067714.1 hypothetical protein [Nocardia albiluteola]
MAVEVGAGAVVAHGGAGVGEMEGAAAPFAEDLARVGAVVDQDDEI